MDNTSFNYIVSNFLNDRLVQIIMVVLFIILVFVVIAFKEIYIKIRFLFKIYPIYLKNYQEAMAKKEQKRQYNGERYHHVEDFFKTETGYNNPESILKRRILKECFVTLEFTEMPKSLDEIKKRYRKLAKKYHPDMPTGDNEKFRKIQKAYLDAESYWKIMNEGGNK